VGARPTPTAEQRARLEAENALHGRQLRGAAENARKSRLAREHFAAACHLFADHRPGQVQIERFWLETLELPDTCLRKSMVNAYSKYSQKKRRNMLPYGTCKLTVHRTRIVQTIYGGIQEYGGFERPEWLD